jgi:hypothetical protein
MGGIRGVRLWTEKPAYDHRPMNFYCSLHDTETDEFHHEVYLEGGWWAQSGCVPAKAFFKQDKDLRSQVMGMVWDSINPAPDCPYPSNQQILESENDYDLCMQRDLDPLYEAKCKVHQKRFLIEVDIRASTTVLVEPRLIWDVGMTGVEETIISAEQLCAKYYLDQDNNKPTTYDFIRDFEQHFDRAL